MSSFRRAGLLSAACAFALIAPSVASAQTLADAVSLAYASNPTLQQQRAQLRALDENYVQARQGYRPTADVGGSASYQATQVRSGLGGTGGVVDGNSGSVELSASQPIYTHGRVTNGVRAVEADILAARESLRQVESSVLLTTIQAFVDVRRDTQSLRIREENVAVLRRQLEESQARFEVGEITRTDVAQSEARLAAAQSLLATGQAQLAISRSNYAAVVGQNPGELEPEPALTTIPTTVDIAFDVAQGSSPALRNAEFSERASRSRIAAARSDFGPSASVQARYGYSGPLAPFGRDQFPYSLSVQAVISQPLFAGGVRSSRVRQTTEQNNVDLIGIETTRRDVLRQVSQSWNQLLAARANIVSSEELVRANRIAAEGVREEQAVGLRTTIEVLNAEQELRNAELQLVAARRDDYVAGASLLSAMGQLEARNVLPGAELYDPDANFQKIKHAGAVPWEPVIEAIDRFVAPVPAAAPAAAKATSDGETINTAR